MLITDCIPCQYGDHDGHHEVIQAVPEGVMGGAECHCKGECRDRPRPKAATVEHVADYADVAEILGGLAGGPPAVRGKETP